MVVSAILYTVKKNVVSTAIHEAMGSKCLLTNGYDKSLTIYDPNGKNAMEFRLASILYCFICI